MKRLIEMVLIAIIAGALVMLVLGVPPRVPPAPVTPIAPADDLAVPRPREPAERDPVATSSVEPIHRSSVSAAPAATESRPVERPPRIDPPATGAEEASLERRPGFVWSGYSYQGGAAALEGLVPVSVDDAVPPRADAAGRFDLRTSGGSLALAAIGERSPRIDLPAVSGQGVLAVHRYDAASPAPSILEPVAALLLQPAGGPPRLLVCGRSTLPDDGEIAIRLIAAGHGLESTVLRVDDGFFGGELPLSPRDYHSGQYVLQFAWGRRLATTEVPVEVGTDHLEQVDGEYRRDVAVFFGTPEDARRQETEVRAYYRAALDDLEGMRDLLLVSGAQARKKRSKILDDPARVARLRSHALAPRFDELFHGKKLDLDRWRKIIDAEIPLRIRGYAEVEEIPYLTKHPQAAHNLVLLAQAVLKYAKLESTVVYEALGRKRHANDFVPSHDFDPAMERDVTLERMGNYADSVRGFVGL